MRILVIADVHGNFEALQKVVDAALEEDFDLLISPGDFTDMFDIPPNFTQLDIADIVVQKLLIPNKPILCIPGNHDPYEILDVFDDYGVNLHGRTINKEGFTFAGWGGAATPFNTLFEPAEDETNAALSNLTKKVKGKWILVTHAPPKNTTLDVLESNKHVGSGAIRNTIVKKKPTLAISAHIHENSGTDKVGETTIFYPGPAYKGFYGLVTIEGKSVKCDIKQATI